MRFSSPQPRIRWTVGIAAFFLCCSIAAAGNLGLRLGLTEKAFSSVEKKYGSTARKRLEDWRELMELNQNKVENEKLEQVNQFFNRLMFLSDMEHWGVEDYWATPVEMLATNGGDCEDFSIAKYFTLVEMGVPVDRLKITYVKALSLNQAHMVLTYYPTPGSIPLVLDNLIPEIKSASNRRDLVPVYSFNGDGLWLAKELGLGRNVGKSDRVGLWRSLTGRIEKEAENK
jgi:predicted transglutaminase-like cysteine proteinase